ncbi:MAG: Isoquinoline 1-oxidoreductase subunit [Pseudomonadota bacterium]
MRVRLVAAPVAVILVAAVLSIGACDFVAEDPARPEAANDGAAGDAADDAAGGAAGGALIVAGLATPAAFIDIADEAARLRAVFSELFKVVSHPRCMNCHPRSGGPLQGDDGRPHQPPVARGVDDPKAFGMGVVGMQCGTCHGADNVAYAGASGSIPGHAPWALAPADMGWTGLSESEICRNLKNVDLNGGRTLDEVLEHHAEDGLVGWAWDPGLGRTPAPGDQETFGALTAAWIEAGAHCPDA